MIYKAITMKKYLTIKVFGIFLKVSQQNSEGTFCFNKHEKYTNTRNDFILKIHTLYEVYKTDYC